MPMGAGGLVPQRAPTHPGVEAGCRCPGKRVFVGSKAGELSDGRRILHRMSRCRTVCFQRPGLIRISKDAFKCNGILPERAMGEVVELFILLVAILGL